MIEYGRTISDNFCVNVAGIMEALHNSLLLAFYLGHPGNNVGNASNEVWAKLPHKVVVRAKVLPSSCQLIQAGCSLQKIQFWGSRSD